MSRSTDAVDVSPTFDPKYVDFALLIIYLIDQPILRPDMGTVEPS
jgi:hypothetical protein